MDILELNPNPNEIWYTNDSCTNATIPHNLNAFGANIISNTYDFKKQCWVISFDKDITIIGDKAFLSCADLTQVVLPDSVRIIESQAFCGCYRMKDIPKAKNVTYYGFAAFQSCNSLSSINIPDSVETIRGFVFYNCKRIQSVTIPNSVKLIGLRAFSNGLHLTEVYCKAIIPPSTLTLGNQWNPFDYYDNDNVYPPTYFEDVFCKIFVPMESLPQYKAAFGWCNYISNIIGYDFEKNEIVENNPNFKSKPFDNEIWYTNGSTSQPTFPCKLDSLDSKIISNIYDKEKGYWIMTFEYKVTKVGELAFSRCLNLKSIILPNTIEIIENRAFESCLDLTSVIFGKGLSEIKDYAFNGCSNITNIIIPDKVISIGDNPFVGCLKLTEFRGKFASEDGKFLIADGKLIAYAIGCSDSDCLIPDTVMTIEKSAFSQCDTLKYVNIPNSVISIGDNAFSSCKNLINISIPDSVTSIGDFAFGWCKKLTDLVIPKRVITIGEGAFQTCYGLYSVSIPDSVIKIGEAAFCWCTNLKSVLIPNSVKTIGARAFKSCLKLTCINIPETLSIIKYRTFFECNALTTIVIPDSVKEIESEAFSQCSNLKKIFCKAKIPPIGNFFMFNYGNDCKIYVPGESLDIYKSTDDWSKSFDRIIACDFNKNSV